MAQRIFTMSSHPVFHLGFSQIYTQSIISYYVLTNYSNSQGKKIDNIYISGIAYQYQRIITTSNYLRVLYQALVSE